MLCKMRLREMLMQIAFAREMLVGTDTFLHITIIKQCSMLSHNN
jgi:hypothetical protein